MDLILLIKYSIALGLISILMFLIGILTFRLARNIVQAFSGYGVPFVRTGNNKLEKLLECIKLNKWETFMDLGCGDGKILEAISEKFPESTIIWYERSYYPYKLAIEKKEINKLNYQVYQSDFFEASFENVNIIYTYLMPHLMKKIWIKMKSECPKGALLYSSSFPVNWVEPIQTISTNYRKGKNIFVYEVQ